VVAGGYRRRVPTLRAAAALLAAADSVPRLIPLLRALGFDRPPLTLAAEARHALGLPSACGRAAVVEGAGTLRALAVEVAADGAPLRQHVARLAARLAARSPHLLWLVAAAEPEGGRTAVATWPGDRTPPRVAALVVDRSHVVDSDAETIAALATAADATTADLLVHARWQEVLGRDALGRRFYRALERVVAGLADAATGEAAPADRREVALLYVSRLLFLAFLEAKGWLDGDRGFLARGFARCVASGGHYHRRVLLPLFFGTLNTPPARRAPVARALGAVPFLNGGLFARSPLERRCRRLAFPDAALGRVYGELLSRYRFTAREDGSGWTEAAVDPEMLGRAFESLMAARERRTTGAFYTPQPLVEHVTAAALATALGGDDLAAEAAAALRGETVPAEARDELRARLARLRVLDPACGSGAFLVHALERMAALAAALGDPRPTAETRRGLLTRSVFGVDVNPTAVWLCELRLWLSVVIEGDERDPSRVPPLPNLDRHVRVGDSLAGGHFGDDLAAAALGRGVRRLRDRYARATGARKRALADALERAERGATLARLGREIAALSAERAEIVRHARARDLFDARRGLARGEAARLADLRRRLAAARARRRVVARGGALPFAYAAHFADAAAAGGFDLVLGNPPWVRLQNIPRESRAGLRSEFAVYRGAAWAAGAEAAHAGAGFAAQVDLAALFVERSLQLLAPGRTLALLLPAKLWRSLAGGGVRRFLAAHATVTALEDFAAAPAAFDAAVYPSLLVARRAAGGGGAAAAPDGCVRATLHRATATLAWTMPRASLPLSDPASPWLLLPAAVRAAFDRVAAAGTPLGGSALGGSALGRPALGVKCGRNDAFVVRVLDDPGTGDGARVGNGARTATIEAAALRPLVHGEDVGPWAVARTAAHLVWTHGADGDPLVRLPAGVEAWLAPSRAALLRRSDLRAGLPWWSLFRTGAASPERARVVWPDIGRAPRAAVLPAGDPRVPLNSCYVVACSAADDAHALAALLNGPLAAAWLNVLAEPARGGYHRYLGWTTALLPVPRRWAEARPALARLGARGAAGDPPSAAELLAAALDAFGLRFDAVAPLVAWNER
jgi:hypothetical protein